ncbi:hypothetical protein Pmar_PMAR017938 [Perkinsus marinus ATCC 50983]|uniref:RRM domain-containing protein n=1 Tax=Perkinsus marinus (strain ATCC 50983 / TXsc) TaxID=423536 RepID=C5LIB9_PERM5|nr:hypothetical protein Pmar_PMAR017938 [Perkinsus marinus ATCC 50983]EER03535.1 hypothetical protein Pmar_PMAR017938 [Perkinsus marinus ATCC 50983]|eukprot:XP_002771719.1 hypothetical protein Pmar_PMAR017938 [Perkinsus marinus ATCC 50983]
MDKNRSETISHKQYTVKPSEILGNLGKTKPSSPQAPTSPVSLEDLPTATPGKAAATVDPRGDALGGIKKEWVSGVFKWIAKLDGLWYMRGNATTVIKYRFKPVDALADDRGRFMAVQIEDSPANVGYLILKEPESRHMNNYFYTDLVSLEDLRPAVKEKGVLWQLTEGCFNSNFDTLTFIRPSDDPKSGGTQWLVFDRQPRKKSDTPDSRESRRSSQQQQQHVVTPEAPHSGRHEDGGGDRYGDWTHWKKSDSAWQWDDYNKSYEGEGKWRNHQKGWGQEWKKGETRFKGVVDWNRVEYHPDWRRFTGEWYGFKQYGEAPRPSFKSYELPGPHKDDHLIDMATILFVYGFPRSYSEDDLKEAFSKFGEVQEAKVKRKWGHRGYGAGYGWIRYANRDECERCIAATKNKMTFQGMNYPAKVRPAMDKDFHLEYRDKLYPEDMARRRGIG